MYYKIGEFIFIFLIILSMKYFCKDKKNLIFGKFI